MKNITFSIFFVAIMFGTTAAIANPPGSAKSKFYNFGEQVIDGEIKKPTALYTNSRNKVKFERLLNLKKSFMPDLLETAKSPTFR